MPASVGVDAPFGHGREQHDGVRVQRAPVGHGLVIAAGAAPVDRDDLDGRRAGKTGSRVGGNELDLCKEALHSETDDRALPAAGDAAAGGLKESEEVEHEDRPGDLARGCDVEFGAR